MNIFTSEETLQFFSQFSFFPKKNFSDIPVFHKHEFQTEKTNGKKNLREPFGSSPVLLKIVHKKTALKAVKWRRVQNYAAPLLLPTSSKFASVAPLPLLIKTFCALAVFFCHSVGKKISASLSVRALYS